MPFAICEAIKHTSWKSEWRSTGIPRIFRIWWVIRYHFIWHDEVIEQVVISSQSTLVLFGRPTCSQYTKIKYDWNWNTGNKFWAPLRYIRLARLTPKSGHSFERCAQHQQDLGTPTHRYSVVHLRYFKGLCACDISSNRPQFAFKSCKVFRIYFYEIHNTQVLGWWNIPFAHFKRSTLLENSLKC